jgi:hypothetical protein
MSVFDDMARDAGYRGDEAAQVARRLEEDERRQSETGCECSAMVLDDGRCSGCGRSVLERVSRPGRPGADYEASRRCPSCESAEVRAIVARLCALTERVMAETHGWQHASDCICGEGGFWRSANYSASDFRHELKTIEFIERAVEVALANVHAQSSPVESAARSVAPWCADHVRESEGSRQPKDGAA